MELNVFKELGLTDSQARGYLALIEKGKMTPVDLAKDIGETRTNGYAIAEKLTALGLVEKDESDKKITFAAKNPSELRNIITRQRQELTKTSEAITGILPMLLSKFHLTSDQPGVMTVEGASGLQVVFDEVIATRKDFLIIAADDMRRNEEISKLIDKQIAKQARLGIKTFVLAHADKFQDLSARHRDNPHVILRSLPTGVKIDAQIMIFGNSIVSTIFKPDSTTKTIMTSPHTAMTMKSMFDVMWNLPQ